MIMNITATIPRTVIIALMMFITIPGSLSSDPSHPLASRTVSGRLPSQGLVANAGERLKALNPTRLAITRIIVLKGFSFMDLL